MQNTDHPFRAIAALAACEGLTGLTLKVERGGDYVRLVHTDPPVFFKYKPDAADQMDRTALSQFKRLQLSEEDCAMGPVATLDLIRSLLSKFAEYSSQPTGKKPKTGVRR